MWKPSLARGCGLRLGSETWGCLIGCRSSPAKAGSLVTTNRKRGWTLARDGNAEAVRIWRELTLLQLCVSCLEILAVVTDTPERALKRHCPEECEGADCSVRPESWSGTEGVGAGSSVAGGERRSPEASWFSFVSSCVVIMPRTRSQTQATIHFPKKKLVKTPSKASSKESKVQLKNVQAVPATPCADTKLLPLSPRKRLGDDNLCNTPHLSPCSPPKLGKKENGPPRSHTRKGCRLVFDDELTVKSSSQKEQDQVHQNQMLSSAQKGQESESNSEQKCPPGKESGRVRLFKQEGTCYQQAKLVLNTAVPDRLPAREKEMDVIRAFLKKHICGKKAGSLYLSGAPGTGKTACLSRILQDLKKEVEGFETIMLNCMSLRSAQAVFPAIAQEIGQEKICRPAGKDLVRTLEKQLTAEKGPMIVLVLDEMDQLDSKGQDVLYTLFEWPWLSNSRLVLIGVANTLDLTDRILPRLEARENCKPQLLNFPPYTRNQIVAILQERLSQVSRDQVLDNAAIQFCARKVSAVSGDIRKALDVCRRAIEIVESDVKSQTVLKPLSGGQSPSETPVPKRVGLTHISQVISEVDGNRVTLSQDKTQDSLPLQQKILVCSLLLLTQRLKLKEVTLGKLYEAYSSVCRKQQVAAVDQSECLSLSGLLESRGVLGLKKNKESRLTKVSLKIEENELEHVLKGQAFIGNILNAGLP